MSTGELLTRVTIWIAIVGYTVGSITLALAGRIAHWDSAARIAWTIASLSLVAHVICAFQFYHAWSHESAYSETARQTNEVVGLNWGGGLFINYFLMLSWIVDVGWWWRRGLDSYRKRPWPLVAAWHGFLIFIIFNATVVFKAAAVRWVGLCVCVTLVIAWLYLANQWRTPRPIR